MSAFPFSTSSNPYTLPNTRITETSTDALALSVRVHRQSSDQEVLSELYYYRDSSWVRFPLPPLSDVRSPIRLTSAIGEPARLEFKLIDKQGRLAKKNLNSPYNVNAAGAYDPLLDEARKILYRVGVRCFANLVAGVTGTASTSPSAGSMSNLTNGTLADWTGTPSSHAVWTIGGAGNLDLTYDLGAVVRVRHGVIRFGTKIGSYTLPNSVQVMLSSDGTNWVSLPIRPVGGTLGDWDEDREGRAVEVVFADIGRDYRYVRFRVSMEAAQTLTVDEVAVYGGMQTAYYGRNAFVGYLGDSTDSSPTGEISLKATDPFKKLADNNSVRLTAAYQLGYVGDIGHNLLTNSAYWKAQSPYNTAFSSGEVGWSYGSKFTNMQYPVWQGQGGSLLTYLRYLFDSIGWHTYWDGNGVLQAFEPPYLQRLPDRVMLWTPDGNKDVWDCVRDEAGKDIRNTVIIASGKIETGALATKKWEPNSVARWGERTMIVTDPIASTSEIQSKVGNSILRDYAWRDQTLQANLYADFDTLCGRLYGFRTAVVDNPSFSNLYSKESSVAGNKRLQELWLLESLEMEITNKRWRASGSFAPYFAWVADPPQFVSLVPQTTPNTDKMVATWNAITDAHIVSVRVYVGTTASGPFTLYSTVSSSLTSTTIAGLTPGVRYFVYLTGVDDRGYESLPSNVLTAVAGGAATDTSGWTVTDLAVGLQSQEGPDSLGYYTYQFYFTWTSPPIGGVANAELGGFKRMRLMANPYALPSGDTEAWDSWAWYDEGWEWHGDYIGPELDWYYEPGQLSWTATFRTTTQFVAGDKIYWRMWTSSATSRWRRWGGDSLPGWPSNVVYYTFA